MLKNKPKISHPYVGYVFLLLSFVMLGTLVAGLALQSGTTAMVGGVGLVVTLAGSVFGFRLGAKQLAKAREGGDPTHNISIWSQPLRQEAIDTYLQVHRGLLVEETEEAAVEDKKSTVHALPTNGRREDLVATGSSRLSA
ncbi:hypothetical protein [[Mycobacterium] burgundiense]|uniref:Uncharacterized protein n=1 Tax=[Mycobacterium] burgundiense TaxID=3064286 RepID=A0ABM9LRC4_9MYCO|nr:hypothetical protein [Mycolicibacterium sp. MU0053]CAJ1503460.1 hypothetical protein MU0053_002441 [Mycolicibacterium sp. MU0053]